MLNYLTKLPMRTQMMMTTTTSLFSSHSNNSLSHSKEITMMMSWFKTPLPAKTQLVLIDAVLIARYN